MKYLLQFASICLKIFASICFNSLQNISLHSFVFRHTAWHGHAAWRWTYSMYSCMYSCSLRIMRYICFRSYLFHFYLLLFASYHIRLASMLLFASYHICFASICFLSYLFCFYSLPIIFDSHPELSNLIRSEYKQI